MITKITHLSLFVHNQDEALEFYTQKLGFIVHTNMAWDNTMRWITITPAQQKDFEIALMQATTEQEKALVGTQGARIPFYCVETDDCKKTYAEFKTNGVECVSQPEEMPWGTSALIKDLYGNLINIVEPK